MLVRSILRNDSISSAEHNAYVASMLIRDGSGSGSALARPAGSAAVATPPSAPGPPTGSSSSSMPPVAPRAVSGKRMNGIIMNAHRSQELEVIQNMEAETAAVVLQIRGIEREVQEVQEAITGGSEYRGRRGESLQAVEGGLVRKEQLLREKEKQLRDEKMMLFQQHNFGSQHTMASAPSTTVEGPIPAVLQPQKRISIVMATPGVGSPAEEKKEQRRLSQLMEAIERRSSMSGLSQSNGGSATDAVIVIHKIEEDPRLLARIGALELPILVSTLLAGFTLVMFNVASTDTARGLAVLSFGLESSASTVLCLIAFRGQQLYSRATDVNPLTIKFLQRICPVTVIALLTFALGVVTFVLAFVIEASEELGASWLAVVALVFCPTLVAGVLFAVSTVQVRRHSLDGTPPNSE